jgi:hypothetical protein
MGAAAKEASAVRAAAVKSATTAVEVAATSMRATTVEATPTMRMSTATAVRAVRRGAGTDSGKGDDGRQTNRDSQRGPKHECLRKGTLASRCRNAGEWWRVMIAA